MACALPQHLAQLVVSHCPVHLHVVVGGSVVGVVVADVVVVAGEVVGVVGGVVARTVIFVMSFVVQFIPLVFLGEYFLAVSDQEQRICCYRGLLAFSNHKGAVAFASCIVYVIINLCIKSSTKQNIIIINTTIITIISFGVIFSCGHITT